MIRNGHPGSRCDAIQANVVAAGYGKVVSGAQRPNVCGSRSIFQSRSPAIALSQLGTTQAEPSACPTSGGPLIGLNAADGSTTSRETAVTKFGIPTASRPI